MKNLPHKTLKITADLYHYLLSVSLRENDVLYRLREQTAAMPNSGMQISPDQGQFLALLVKLIGAKRVLEIGVFTGYSSLWMAQALPEDGQIIACDVSQEWTDIGRDYWREGGVEKKIDLRLGPAAQTLEQLLAEGRQGAFDLAFIDADKSNYDTYYEQCLQLLHPGALILIDNILWGGSVIDESRQDADTQAIRAVTKKVHQDDRVDMSLVPINDGLILARIR